MAVKAPDAPAFPFLAGRDQKVPVIFGKPGDCRVYSVVFCVLSVLSIRSNRKYWYRVYSDNWCEQGGRFNHGSSAYDWTGTVTLLKSFNSTNYSVIATAIRSAGNGCIVDVRSITKTNFIISEQSKNGGGGASQYVIWEACGYI